MKKLKLFLFALTLVFITSTTVLAESKWDTIQPVKQTTSDGIDIEYQTKVEFQYKCYDNYGEEICQKQCQSSGSLGTWQKPAALWPAT